MHTPRRLNRRGALLHRARHPLVVLSALVLVSISASRLPVGSPEDSGAVRLVIRVRERLVSNGLLAAPTSSGQLVPGAARSFGYQYVRVEGERAYPIEFENDSWDTVSKLLAEGVTIGRVSYMREVHRTGIWSPWIERSKTITSRITIGIKAVDEDPLRSSMLRAAADGLGKQFESMGSKRVRVIADEIAKGGGSSVRVLWFRAAWNLGTLLCALVLVHGVVTQPRWWRRRRLTRRGCCPKCRYDILAIPVIDGVRTCPECGVMTRWEESVSDASHAPTPSSRSPR
jgi:hypothetical protein